jgi:hypothetical protein
MEATSFGFKCKWMAVKHSSSEFVIDLLRVHNPKQSDWAEGIGGAYEGRVFVSCPLDSWILAVSIALPEFGTHANRDGVLDWVCGLSMSTGSIVQYFCSHRVVEYHAWCWAEKGQILRAFAYSGETASVLLDLGTKTDAERQVDSMISAGEASMQQTNEAFRPPNEDYVMLLAGLWSIDPTMLEQRFPAVEPGWLGTLGWL